MWQKVLKCPVRNQTLLFSDPPPEGDQGRAAGLHRDLVAAFEAAAKEYFGRVLFMVIPSEQVAVRHVCGQRGAALQLTRTLQKHKNL